MFQDERSNDNIYTFSIDKLHCEGVCGGGGGGGEGGSSVRFLPA